ncbi:MAG: 50S ribosomal protein L3 [Patescibacteria group bacterium]|jgi:large subunit ribosomal protein L3
MKFIIGKKIEMTQVWQGEKVVAVTKVQAGPCPVVQIKNTTKDGYSAVQLGFDEKKEKNIKKPQLGHLKKAGIVSKDKKTNLKYAREFRDEIKDLKVGDIVSVDTFEVGDVIKATGTSKGKGFQGGVRRYHFHGHNKTHGTKDQVRTGGSIGAGGPQHVFKGLRMPGRMGNAKSTTSNLKIVQIDKENNILYISGAVPGARNGLVLISGKGDLKIAQPIVEKVEEVKPEAKVEEIAKVEAVEEKKVEEKKEEAPVKENKKD